jgi:hypothetical protein
VKLTIKDVAKMSGLADSTIRQYAWERGIGRIEGRTKVFTPAEAQKLSGKSKRSKSPGRQVKAEGLKIETAQVVARRRSVWSILGFGAAKDRVGTR